MHAFNLIVKNVVGFTSTAPIFCETRWYSISKVCLGVSTFERGFQYCLRLSETEKTKYPKIKDDIKAIINDRYHFASNDTLVKVIKPIVDAIGRLESREATLADIFKELIHVHLEISRLDIPIVGFKAHALAVISKRAREFSDDIYFIALFLSPAHKNMAISVNLQKSPRAFWSEFTGNSPLLRRFALKVLAIVPHGAACERLFSSLGLTKTKSRNRLSPDTLSRLGHIKSELQKAILAKKKNIGKKKLPESGFLEENISILFEDENEDSEDEIEQEKIEGLDEINENIDLVDLDLEYEDTSAMEEFFDFDAFERDQEAFSLDNNHSTLQSVDSEEGYYSIINYRKFIIYNKLTES